MTTPSLDLFAALQAVLDPQYRLERELGRGGMGVVFLATDTTLDRRVAIKAVHPELAAHQSIGRRFLAEARTIARLRHPNIVAVHTAGNADGLLYYVMDEVEGESLRQRLVREQRLDPPTVARIVADLAAALDAAGRAGVVHRDVKPENVLLDQATGRALLADFGIARAMAGESATSSTGQGVAVGTPAYMSPEQASGEEIDGRSDLYALGVVAYEMLAGAPPFRGPNRVVVSKHIAERPAPIERLRPDAPRPLAAAIMRALEKQPADRWQTGEAFRQALATRAAGRAAPAPAPAGVLAGVVVALALAAGAFGLPRRSPGPPSGVNPRHSILVLPFDNLRDDRTVDWLRDGSVSMLGLNLSQWNDLTVVDHERLHDLLAAHRLRPGDDVGLDLARRLAREAGVWTVVLGDYAQAGDSLHLTARVFDVASGDRVDVARVDDRAGADVRPLFDELAAKLLDLSGAPNEVRIGIARSTTASLEAYRAYLAGVEGLNRWDLAGAERELGRAIRIDTTFGLAYYKLALTRGWLVGTGDSIADAAIVRATAYSANLPGHDRTVINAYRAFLGGEFAEARAAYQQLLARDQTDADAWYGLGEAWFHDTTGREPGARLDPGDPRLQAHAGARPRLRAGLRARAGDAEWRGGRAALLRAGGGRFLRPHRRRRRPRAGRQRHDRRRGPPGACRGAGHGPELGQHPAHHAPGPRRDGGRLPRLGQLRRRPRRGGPLPADRAGAPRAAVRRGPDPLRLGRGRARRPRASHRARHRGAAGLPDLRGHPHGGGRHRRRGQRVRLPGRPRQRRQDDRPGRPGAARSDPAARPRGRKHGARRLAPDGAGRALRRDGCADRVAPPGVAERGRGGADGAGRTGGCTSPTAAPRRRSGCSPDPPRTAAP